MLDVKLAAGIKPIENRLDRMEDTINNMKNDITMLKLFNENVTLPRLNTIESCYLDTYKRYIGKR